MTIPYNISTEKSLKELNEKLSVCNFIEGNEFTIIDYATFKAFQTYKFEFEFKISDYPFIEKWHEVLKKEKICLIPDYIEIPIQSYTPELSNFILEKLKFNNRGSVNTQYFINFKIINSSILEKKDLDFQSLFFSIIGFTFDGVNWTNKFSTPCDEYGKKMLNMNCVILNETISFEFFIKNILMEIYKEFGENGKYKEEKGVIKEIEIHSSFKV